MACRRPCLHINAEAKTCEAEPPDADRQAKRRRARRRRQPESDARRRRSRRPRNQRAAKTDARKEGDRQSGDEEPKRTSSKRPLPDSRKAEKVGEAVKDAAEEIKSKQKEEEKTDSAGRGDHHRRTSRPAPQAVAQEAKKGYDLLVIGLEKTSARGKDFHAGVTEIAQGFDGPARRSRRRAASSTRCRTAI